MNKFILIGLISLLASILFVGVYADDEFSELEIFTKHKPTFKMYFYSPIGMRAMAIEKLSPEKQKEEVAFQEFVLKTGVQFPGKKNDFTWMILIQLTLTFLSLGIYRIKYKDKFEKWLIPLHFIVNFLITGFCIGGIMTSNNIYATIGLSLLILAVNYLSIYKIKNRKIFSFS